ncbi:phosphoglucosamine mutase [Gammaproteobacteria bacterium]|jgi:phosphoglucosamine mutase|nr:phosphoglucosamine mutase [Gammaproteobacteria bacterium]GIS22249.1 MAG: phosphoglucosamine mutase [Gammaproteobacteria bacterium]
MAKIINAKKKFFGTDGIRGPISSKTSPDFILKLGWAAGEVFKDQGISSFIIGKDTRISGYMLEAALQAGIISSGLNVRLVGPLPTPAISYLVSTFKSQAGIVISASHNSYEDNGIKFFDDKGQKISDELELLIEQKISEPIKVVEPENLGKAARLSDASGRYIEYCKNSLSKEISLNNLKIVIDTANGAAYDVAPKVFRELGAEVVAISDDPNGLNINQNCGSTDLNVLKKAVLDNNADFGIAFDGDGDRLIIVDSEAKALDGDDILFLLAKFKFENQIVLGSKGVVGTDMTNKGLENALSEMGIELVRSKVGDKYVLEKLLELGWQLGGEQSGHIICLDSVATGDAIIAAIKFFEAFLTFGKPLNEILGSFKKYPQILTNVEVANAESILANKKFKNSCEKAQKEITEFDGKILVRKSGTESLLRILVEAKDSKVTEIHSKQLTDLAKDLA